MRIGVYPGSFNPLHVGHRDVIQQALGVMDRLVVLRLQNPAKPVSQEPLPDDLGDRVLVLSSTNLLVDWLEEHPEVTCVVRGIRGGRDTDEALDYKFWNEDLGLKVPIVHFLPRRDLVHMSSSAIRGLRAFGVEI